MVTIRRDSDPGCFLGLVKDPGFSFLKGGIRIQIWVVLLGSDPGLGFFSLRSDPVFSRRSAPGPGKIHPDAQPCSKESVFVQIDKDRGREKAGV